MANPQRMCIVCRGRFAQALLFRFVVRDGGVTPFKKLGRSFYLCQECTGSRQMEKKISYVAKLSKERASVEAKKLIEYCALRSCDKEKGSN